MFVARVYITVMSSISDPEGQTVLSGLHQLGFDSVRNVRSGKYFQIWLKEECQQEAELKARGICDKLLANPIIEEYRIAVEQVNDD